MSDSLSGIAMEEQTASYLKKEIFQENSQDVEFSYFAKGSTPQMVGRAMPDSPDPDMSGCRIKLLLEE